MQDEECKVQTAELQTEEHRKFCMSNILTNATVLGLNRNRQAIVIRNTNEVEDWNLFLT